ncbi:MAG: ATP-binding protein, partial [Acetobacteraceae bacterium]|nr:ATP-binding protein [Acetobacteraceae bacterium]
ALAGLRLEPSQIARAAAEARAAAWPDERPPDGAALLAAGRRAASVATPRFARRIPPEAGLDRIVLPPDRHAQLREIVVQVRHAARVQEAWGFRELMLYGRGVAALFAGPSGTGKTISARAIAGELGMDLLQIDLAQIVSKYIGETEKNLAAVFAAAEAADVALLFDEADALFGKRSEVKDAHDRYANIETAYLLQRLEEFSGLAILTTNLKPNLDTAFLRRLRFVVDFPRPDAALRAEIWRRAFPPRAPLDPDLDLDVLADSLDLTGGSIQSAALRAAYLAAGEDRPIAMRHLAYACRRELLKLGQLSAERELAALAAAWTDGPP